MFTDFGKREKVVERERREEEREEKREKGEILICCLPYVPQPGIEPTTQFCALTAWPGPNLQPLGVQDNDPIHWATWPGPIF